MSAKFEVVLCERDHNGNKTGKKLSIATNDADFLAGQFARDTTKGVPKAQRKATTEKLFSGCE